MNIQAEIIDQLNNLQDKTLRGGVDALINAGARPEDRKDILTALEDTGAALEIGEAPAKVMACFAEEYQKDRQRRKDEAARREAQEEADKLQEILSQIREEGETRSPSELKEGIADILESADKLDRIANPEGKLETILTPTKKSQFIERIKNKPPAVETGFGFQKGEPLLLPTGALSLIAAPTGHGKTTFLLNLLIDAARREPGKKHFLFSYEEEQAAILVKALSVFCGEGYSRSNRRTIESYYKGDKSYFQDSRLDSFETRATEFWDLVEKGILNVIHCDYSAETLTRLIKGLGEDREGTGLILADYAQLLYPESRDSYSARTEELKRICLDLKDVAVETGLPVVLAAQFNREVRTPYDMEPQRIADSSDLEKAANKVIGLWNGDKRPKEPNPARKQTADKRMRQNGIEEGTLYLEILKARDEESGGAVLYEWDGNIGAIGQEGQPLKDPTRAEAMELQGERGGRKASPSSLLRGQGR